VHGVGLYCLYGGMAPSEQDAILKACPKERSRLILATNIAETSLTLDGVSVVLDSGWERRGRYDPQRRAQVLDDRRISLASATQRQGRAGRQGPGQCYRLWDEANLRAMAAFGRAEILEADLSALVLSLKAWGVRDIATLKLLDYPSMASLIDAEQELIALNLLDGSGTITPKGKIVQTLGLTTRLGHMVYEAHLRGQGKTGSALAMILMEPQRLGQGIDLQVRIEQFWRSSAGIFPQRRAMALELFQSLPSLSVTKLPYKDLSIGGLLP